MLGRHIGLSRISDFVKSEELAKLNKMNWTVVTNKKREKNEEGITIEIWQN